MKKLFALLGLIFAFATLPTITTAVAPPANRAVQRVAAWNLIGNYVIDFSCSSCVPHNITISSYNPYTGVFSGYGTYSANPAFKWTVTGMVTGSQITMKILYTGQDAGYYVNMTGLIAANGVMSGSAIDRSGDQFTWTASGIVKSYKNHGQFVSHQDDKRMAAHSDFGMPNRQ